MNIFDKLRLIRDVIQQDVGNRGLARDPNDNLINACPDDFADVCHELAEHTDIQLGIVTGFFIPHATPPAGETDGPLGALFLARAFREMKLVALLATDPFGIAAFRAGIQEARLRQEVLTLPTDDGPDWYAGALDFFSNATLPTHLVAIERVGPCYRDGRCYTMSGRDITDHMRPAHFWFENNVNVEGHWDDERFRTIGIGDGGNEIGMGKIPHETIVKNIPNGDLIHCRVPTDFLIVAGVSNWGAYALAAGVALLRGVDLPDELFDPDRERAILQKMVEAGPLVDGVTGQQTATVDGLTWEQYIEPLVRIREIMKM